MARVCVFCGSRPGEPVFQTAAKRLGQRIAERGLGLVYGGASVGLMGIVADAALAAGGEVIGVIPRSVFRREIAHTSLTTLHVVDTMHERKALMARESDAFLAFPGGLGTFDELFEILTWSMIGIHQKPIGILDVGGYFAPLRAVIDNAIARGFLESAPIRVWSEDADEVLDALCATVGRQ
jgi:uncharacterized protein (TIGR00730 family)